MDNANLKGAASIKIENGEIIIKIKVDGGVDGATDIEPRPKRSKVSYEKDFETWWSKYPRSINKSHAYKKFCSLTAEERAKALETIDYWAKYYEETEAQFIPHASTFLNQRRFNEVPPEENTKVIGQPRRTERTPEEKMFNQQHLGYHAHPLWSYYARAWTANTLLKDSEGMPVDFPTFANYFTKLQRGDD